MANTQLSSLLSAIYRTPPFDTKTGQITVPWQLFLSALVNSANGGGGGNTTIKTAFGITDDRNALDQKVADLESKLNYVLMNPAMSIAMQAVEVQQANNSVTTAGDVLDLIRLSETGLIISGTTAYLAALPDSSANLDFTVHWNDLVNSVANANSTIGNSNSATEIQLAGPVFAVGGAIDVQFLTIVNNDRINCNVALYFNNSSGGTGNTNIINDILLQPGFTLVFDENGFKVLNAAGVPLR